MVGPESTHCWVMLRTSRAVLSSVGMNWAWYIALFSEAQNSWPLTMKFTEYWHWQPFIICWAINWATGIVDTISVKFATCRLQNYCGSSVPWCRYYDHSNKTNLMLNKHTMKLKQLVELLSESSGNLNLIWNGIPLGTVGKWHISY